MVNQPIIVDRPPRIQPELPIDEIEVPLPPDKEDDGYAQLIQMGLPLLTIIGYILISTVGGSGRNPLFLIPMALSVVASVAFSIYSYRTNKIKREEMELAYEEKLIEMSKEMEQYHDLQRRFYRYNYPDSRTTFAIVRETLQEATKGIDGMRSKARLWERRASDDDFGVLRLGMGTLPSTVVYTCKEAENFEDPQVRDALKLADDSRFVNDIPIVISLRQNPAAADASEEDDEEQENVSVQASTVHAMSIAGGKKEVYDYIRALLAHYVVFHAPGDAKLFVLGHNKDEWVWTEQLPHSQVDDQHKYRFFTGDPDLKKQQTNEDEGSHLDQYLEGIRKVLSQRKIRLQDRDQQQNDGGNPTSPLLLTVVDLLDVSANDHPLHDVESDGALSMLINEGSFLGGGVIFLVPNRAKAPSGCQAVVEVEKTVRASNNVIQQDLAKLYFRYAETGVNTPRYVGEADAVTKQNSLQNLAGRLAKMQIKQGYGGGLVKGVPYLSLIGCQDLDDLRVVALEKWIKTCTPTHADWLKAKLGKMQGNKIRTMKFSAKKDGVHGLVAGSTGSGKSEMLISLLVDMAVNYDPTMLNFVLVDYKGGGAFNEFQNLPHCVDIITNLNSSGVVRMFTAIQSEMKRRQKMNTDTQTKDIVEYRQKGFHQNKWPNGEDPQPYPFLFIIIDEFAEMIADQPEFKSELESITRVGRAQGVSLILASQQPDGVTDQMRANIKFRICLRVESASASRELLRRSDAAFLPSIPGRGYLQVGNEEIELVQVAYTGEKYTDPKQAPAPNVLWPDRSDEVVEEVEPPELYKAIIGELDNLSNVSQLPTQYAPWPSVLPTDISLSHLLAADSASESETPVTSKRYLDDEHISHMMLDFDSDPRQFGTIKLNPAINTWLNGEKGWLDDSADWPLLAMRPVIGLVDDPYRGKQAPLVADFRRGHIALFGASGWGKTTFIRSLVVSLAATHSPNHLHMYLLDLGGRNLSVLKDLPHVGAVINPDEEGYKERVEQLMRELEQIIDSRKETLSSAQVSHVYEYNQIAGVTPLHSILVAVDNFAEFATTFNDGGNDFEGTLDRFVSLVRQSQEYGIHFITTMSRLTDINNQIFSLFSERFTLKLSEAGDYRTVVGGQVEEIPDIPGRGFYKEGLNILSFQVAQPIDLRRRENEPPANETKELERFIVVMNNYIKEHTHSYREPIKVGALPKGSLFRDLLARETELPILGTAQEMFAHLQKDMKQNWLDSLDKNQADWLQVMLGVVSGNRPRTLALEAKKDGVHGMVAGGTGSGKSELLLTLIVSLALNYDPDVLNFVLVDYKGGGAFQPFEKLPHCVDIVTNLNKSAVRRMFTAIDAEMRRRQKMNVDTETKDIVEYREKGFHQRKWPTGAPPQPYPHLFIIIDEYAEMISDTPEFKDELESITRLGRAQGINLLLASQRPIGVTDQMRANIKFRICLRVEELDTSREMLRRPDAAFLPSGMPGRGYIQIGNENIELIQVAYTGETYDDLVAGEQSEDSGSDGDKAPKFYDKTVDLAAQLLLDEQRRWPKTPWPTPLPQQSTLNSEVDPVYLTAANLTMLGQGKPNQSYTLNPFIGNWVNTPEIESAIPSRWPGVDWSERGYAMQGIIGLVDDPHNAQNLPLVVNLRQGHAVLFGASGWGKTTFIRTLITSLAATHSPTEFHAHVFDLGGRSLEVLRALPHVGTVIIPDERGYEERVQQLLRELNMIVDTRKQLFGKVGTQTLYEYNSGSYGEPLPAILVAIDNFAEFIETFGAGSRKNKKDDDDNLLDEFVLLVRQAKSFGVHFIITASRLNVLSSKLYSLFTERFTLRLSDGNDYRAIVGGSIDEIDEIPGRGYTRIGRNPLQFQVALPIGWIGQEGVNFGELLNEKNKPQNEAQQIRALGKRMDEELEKRSVNTDHLPLRIDALPEASIYRQVLQKERDLIAQDPFLPQLRESTHAAWETARSADKADWLKVVLGVTSGDRHRELYLAAKADGVHGIVAGGTGSGKSELLMTFIVGLALNYPPDILNFVLVDYKGGGAFKPFENLPHCVDIVTNLNKSAVARMFTAINAEMKRRQKMNADTNTKDIVDYRKKGFHQQSWPDGSPPQSYPHLFIIIDEYAEMIDDNPEYLKELESITRVGRAQGVMLLLASQRPKGVTDQMRANIKLKLCLRVEQIDTSRELLRRPDAALLPSGMPGRGYLQVGNENLELLQVSWTGDKQINDDEIPVLWDNRQKQGEQADEEEDNRLFDAVVQITSQLENGQRAPKPWPSFLPTQFSLQSVLYDAKKCTHFALLDETTDWLNGESDHSWSSSWQHNNMMNPVVGLLDDPAEAVQIPLHFNLKQNHVAIFGDAGWGKTSFIRTILTSCAVNYSPNDVHIYILDLAGLSYRAIEAFPHVGAAIYTNDETFDERLQRLLAFLNREIDRRQLLISQSNVDNVYDYNQQQTDVASRLPAILVAIDGFIELKDNYESLVDNIIIPLVRRSLTMGVSFVIAGNDPTSLPSRLRSLLGEQVTFKQNNPDRYMEIVGRGAKELDDIEGRGYVRIGRRPLLFQAAVPVGVFNADGEDSQSEVEGLQLLARRMNENLPSDSWVHRPNKIEILPEHIPLTSLIAQQGDQTKQGRIKAIVGINDDLQTAMIDLTRIGNFSIAGPPLSGKTTFLHSWILSIASRYSPDRAKMILVDFRGDLFDPEHEDSIANLPHVVSTVSSSDQMRQLVSGPLSSIASQLASKTSEFELFIFIDNFNDFAEEMGVERENKDVIPQLDRILNGLPRQRLHIVATNGVSRSTMPLWRRIQLSGYGFGLRVAAAVGAQNVTKTPPLLRGDNELIIGRGFIVRSGQTTLTQIATPYDRVELDPVDPNDDEAQDRQKLEALGLWVNEICEKYGQRNDNWREETNATIASEEPSHKAIDPKQQERIDLLQAAINDRLANIDQWQVAPDNKVGQETNAMWQEIMKRVTSDMQVWHDEAFVMDSLRRILYQDRESTSPGLGEIMVNSMDDESVLLEFQSKFATD